MTNLAENWIPAPSKARRSPRLRSDRTRVRCRDQRWPAVVEALGRLRAANRHSVRIVDAECGRGTLMLCAARYARQLGFVAIDARGIDGNARLVECASAAAAGLHDPAIGISFETAEPADALQAETEFPADIVLWHGFKACGAKVAGAVAAAGYTVIADPSVR